MNAIQADALLIHIARNPDIHADFPIIPQLRRNYIPAFFNKTLCPAASLQGRIRGLFNIVFGTKHTKAMMIKIVQKAFSTSQTPLANPKIMQLGLELAKREEPSEIWSNPSIAPLENHMDQLAADAEDEISRFSLLRPEAQRKRLIGCLHLIPLPPDFRERILALIPSLTFDSKNAFSHVELAELLSALPDTPELKAVRDIVLSPIYQISNTDFEAIIMGKPPTSSTREFLYHWLELHPNWAHHQWKKLSKDIKNAEERHRQIISHLDEIPFAHGKTAYLYEQAAPTVRRDVMAMQEGESTLLIGATGTRVASVQRLFQLVHQLPSEIIDGLPEIITSQDIYNNAPQFISKKIRELVDEYTNPESLTPIQKNFLSFITENADREFSGEARQKLRDSLPPALNFLGDLFFYFAKPIYRKGAVSTLEKIDEYSPDKEALRLLSLIARVPGINHTFISGLLLYYCSLLSVIPSGKMVEVLSWVRDNAQRFTDPNLRDTALNELEQFTENLTEKPIHSVLTPIIEKIASGLHTLYKNVLSPNIALALSQMTGIEHPFLSAPFWIKLTKQQDGKFTAHIFGSGHSLYYFQGADSQIKWPRVIGNIPAERLSIAFFQRLLDHTYRAQYDPAMPSASEDLFGDQGTFETLSLDRDLPDTIENCIATDLFSHNSRTPQELRIFTRIIDTEWELNIAALSNTDPHLIHLHLQMHALVNYCRQFIDPISERIKLENAPYLEPLLLEIEKEFQRHEKDLTDEVRTIYETTLHDVRIALQMGKPVSHPQKIEDPKAIPDSIANLIRKGLDGLGIDSDDILNHKNTISWLFGEHVLEAIEHLLRSADRASGITLAETERIAVSDLQDYVRKIHTYCEKFTTLQIQARTVRDHFKINEYHLLDLKLSEASRLRNTAKDNEYIWQEIYARKIHALLDNPAIETSAKDNLRDSLSRVKRGQYRRYEIDLAFTRLSGKMNLAPIQELYSIVDFCHLISCVSRRSNDLHRTLEKKQNFLNAKTAAQSITALIPKNPESDACSSFMKIVEMLEKEHLTHSESREMKNAIRQFKRKCPERLLPYANQIQDCINNVGKIEKTHAPKQQFLQSIYYKTAYTLLDLVLNLVTKTGLARHIYNLFSAACNILPSPVGPWLETAYKNGLRAICQQLFFLFLKFLAYKDLVSADHIQELFSRKEELNLYAREVLSCDHIDFTLPRQIVNPKRLFKHLARLIDLSSTDYYKHLERLPSFKINPIPIGTLMSKLKNQIYLIGSTTPRSTEFLNQVLTSATRLEKILKDQNLLSQSYIEFVTRLKHYIASQNAAVAPLLKQFSRFCRTDGMKYTVKTAHGSDNEVVMDTLDFSEHNLHFDIRDGYAYSSNHPSYYIAPNQNDPEIKMYGSYLLLENREGQRIILLPSVDDLATVSWNGLKHLGPLANPLSHLFPLLRPYVSASNRKGKNSYHLYHLDASKRLISSDAESLSYLITVQMLQGRMADAIHTGEQLNDLLEGSDRVNPDAEMVLWPLMILPNTLEGKAALGQFNHIFHLRQKLLAKFELKIDPAIQQSNNSGFVHAVFIIALLQDLHTRVHSHKQERTPQTTDDPRLQEYLLYRKLHRHVGAIVSKEFHPVDWFEARLLPPSMAKRYRELHSVYEGNVPCGTDHFFRDCIYSGSPTPARNYFGAEASTLADSPLQKMGIIEPVHSDQVEPSIWRRIHSVFRSHVNAIRNPHLDYVSLQTSLALPSLQMPPSLSPEFLRTQFAYLYEVAVGEHGRHARLDLYRNLRVIKGGWDLQSRTLIDLLTTVSGAALQQDKPITSKAAALWHFWSKHDPKYFQAFKWGGLHPLGIITSPIYGMVNHKIWSSNFTKAAEGITQFFGTGTNPPIDLTLTANIGNLILPNQLAGRTIHLTAPLDHINRTLPQITYQGQPQREISLHIFARISLPPDTATHILFDDTIQVTNFPFPFLDKENNPCLQIPHPLRQNYDEAIDHWPSLDAKSYFPSSKILHTYIQTKMNPRSFFDLLHSKAHAYKIVHTYTRPAQKGVIWFIENPLFATLGGKKGLYPLWVEIVHRVASRALSAWMVYHRPIESVATTPAAPLLFDFADLLADENQRFESLYKSISRKIFSDGTSLKRGQPLAILYVELAKLRSILLESTAHQRKRLLKLVNPPTLRNIWRKPIDYRELLLSLFTCAHKGIMDDLRMNREKIFALQTALVRQITREIRLETLNKMIQKLDDISCSGLIDMRSVIDIKCFLSTHFNHVRMPNLQRQLLCYEWLQGDILQKEDIDQVMVILSDKKQYEGVVRKALVKC